ncbi:MAG: hypothetical protein AAFQ13_04915 [Pseudomonadota bacterium]
MFEKNDSFIRALEGQKSGDERGDLRTDGVRDGVRGGDALRAIEWSELTARLSAARDLRRELREDAVLCAGSTGASFGDAAASFFKSLGNGERPVNPEHLEGCKASCGKPPEPGEAAQGDARDDL